MGVLTLAAARAGKGRMDRGGGLGHRGMLYRGLGGVSGRQLTREVDVACVDVLPYRR